jgi:hypothetical protein
LVDGDLARTSGAAQLAAQVTMLRDRWNALSATLRRQTDAGSWSAALATVATLEQIASLNDELRALKQRATDGAAEQRAAAAARASAHAATTTAAKPASTHPASAAAPTSSTANAPTPPATATATATKPTAEPQTIEDMASDVLGGV